MIMIITLALASLAASASAAIALISCSGTLTSFTWASSLLLILLIILGKPSKDKKGKSWDFGPSLSVLVNLKRTWDLGLKYPSPLFWPIYPRFDPFLKLGILLPPLVGQNFQLLPFFFIFKGSPYYFLDVEMLNSLLGPNFPVFFMRNCKLPEVQIGKVWHKMRQLAKLLNVNVTLDDILSFAT